jgi:hydroxyethylthiazole kinase
MTTPSEELARLRAAAPLVQNIANYVAMQTVANVLLAAGASPAMVHAAEEAPEFAALADALTINIGTLSAHWLASMSDTAAAAGRAGTPWVLDPVAVGATGFRRAAARQLLALGPHVIRGNASEILAMREGAGQHAGGVDTRQSVDAAGDAARKLARSSGAVVAVTGAVDLVTDGRRVTRIANGDPLMTRVTAIGCSLTGLIGACLGAGAEPYDGTVAALAIFGVAGELAAEHARGPGSFGIELLDALHRLDGETLDARERLGPLA